MTSPQIASKPALAFARRAVLSLGLGLGLAAAPAVSPALWAQSFPNRSITLVIPFAAGGSTDVVGRIVAQKMSEKLGQQVVVENVGGAGGSTGATRVARADPDGYTILMATVATHALNPLMLRQKPYDPQADFEPISLLVVVPNVLLVNPLFPAQNVADLLALARAQEPGHYSYASSGNGTPLHLSGALFNSLADVDIVHIPSQGSGPALNDVIGNQVPIIFDNLPSASAHIKGGTLRALGVTTKTRAASFPEIPTIDETLPGYETYTWNALFAPKGAPPEVIEALHKAAVEAMADPAVIARMADFSAEIVAGTPEELAAHVAAEAAKWAPVVEEAGVRMD